MPKAVRILKKKITSEFVLYKIQWSNGSKTYEALTSIPPDVMPLIQQWEVRETRSNNPMNVDDSKKNRKIKSETSSDQSLTLPDETESELQLSKSSQSPKPQKNNKSQKKLKDIEKKDKSLFKQEKIANRPLKDPFQINDRNEDSQSKEIKQQNNYKKCEIRQLRQSEVDNQLEFSVLFPNEKQELWLTAKEMKERAPVALCQYLISKIKWKKK